MALTKQITYDTVTSIGTQIDCNVQSTDAEGSFGTTERSEI